MVPLITLVNCKLTVNIYHFKKISCTCNYQEDFNISLAIVIM